LKEKSACYAGIDPTKDALHLGHLLLLLFAFSFSNQELNLILLLGGYTAQIGDPSGKKSERKMLPTSLIKKNIKQLQKQLKYLTTKLTIPSEIIEFINHQI
jgi:tyrosyl-tRNA synthetase